MSTARRMALRPYRTPRYHPNYGGLQQLARDWCEGKLSRWAAMRQIRRMKLPRSFIQGLFVTDESGQRGVGMSDPRQYCPKCGAPMSGAAGRYCGKCEAYR